MIGLPAGLCCPSCNGKRIGHDGYNRPRKSGRKRYRCYECSRSFVENSTWKEKPKPPHRRDLWDFSDPLVEAEWYLQAALHAGTPLKEMAQSILATESELEGLEFLVSHRIILQEKMDEIVEHRRKIRRAFEKLASNSPSCKLKKPPSRERRPSRRSIQLTS
jgi:hypothetical protein